MRIRSFLRRFKMRSVQAGYGDDHDREVDNVDAWVQGAMTQQFGSMGGAPTFPPDYVKDDDDGRPRH